MDIIEPYIKAYIAEDSNPEGAALWNKWHTNLISQMQSQNKLMNEIADNNGGVVTAGQILGNEINDYPILEVPGINSLILNTKLLPNGSIIQRIKAAWISLTVAIIFLYFICYLLIVKVCNLVNYHHLSIWEVAIYSLMIEISFFVIITPITIVLAKHYKNKLR